MSQPSHSISTPLIAAIGMFDGVHLGHRALIASLLDNAAALNLTPAVVTFRNHPRSVLCPCCATPLLMDFDDRVATLHDAGVEQVIALDFTLPLSRLSASDFMAMLRDKYGVKAILMGYNHHFGHDRSATPGDYERWAEQLGMTIVRATEFTESGDKVSSSAIRNLILACDVERAASMLGRPFSIKGIVVHGEQNGRKIGFPTANIHTGDDIITPGNGVYAVWVDVNGSRHPGMCNIGNRPTVSNSMRRSIEVNIFDFDADIYGCEMQTQFVALTRHEQRFASLEELKQRLIDDRTEISRILKLQQ